MQLQLSVLPARLAISRLDAGAQPPSWAVGGGFCSVTITSDETSIVCEEQLVPDGVKTDVGWRALKVAGPLEFSLTGIVLALAAPLADAGIGIFAISTYDTDYVLVKDSAFSAAVLALEDAGHSVELPW